MKYVFGIIAIIGWCGSLAAAPDIELQSTIITFGSVNIVDEASTQSLVLSNTGTSDLEFTSAGISIEPTGEFSVADGVSTETLAAGSSRTLQLVFDPVANGPRTATAYITTNDPDESTATVSLSGAGTAANAIVRTDAPFASMDFEHKVITEEPARPRGFTISNSGTGVLKFHGDGVSLSGPDADSFIITRMPELDPLVNSSPERRLGEVAFAPKSPGPKTASLRITTNDASDPEILISLIGSGLVDRGTTVTGPYTGYGPGISTIKSGGDYDSLAAACAALSATPLTGGDWIFEISGELTETANSSIAQPDTNGNRAIFRPATGTTATITFTNAKSGSPHGHIVIGGPSNHDQQFPTDDIVFDGAEDSAETSRALTLRSVNQTYNYSMIVVYGDSDNITIKNCLIDAHGGLFGVRPAIFLAAYSNPTLPDIPAGLADGFRLQNCRVITRAASIPALSQSSILAYFGHPETGYNTVLPDVRELKILDNEFDANGTVVSSLYGRNIDISGNIINCVVPPDQFNRPFTPNLLEFYGQYSLALPGDLKVERNVINLNGASESDADFSVIAVMNTTPSSTCTIANNMITGLTTAFSNYNHVTRRAIYMDSVYESTGVVVHNSIHMPPSSNSTFGLSGIATIMWNGALTVKNNILSMDAPGCHALSRPNNTGSWISDYNNIYVTSGTYVAMWQRRNVVSLEDWKTSTGQDLNSFQANPFEPAGPYLGAWQGAGSDTADLHFISYPGSEYTAPNLGILTDIDKDPRAVDTVIIGADEVPHHQADVTNWTIYEGRPDLRSSEPKL